MKVVEEAKVEIKKKKTRNQPQNNQIANEQKSPSKWCKGKCLLSLTEVQSGAQSLSTLPWKN